MNEKDQLGEWIGENVVQPGFRALEKVIRFEEQLKEVAATGGPAGAEAQQQLTRLAQVRERMTQALGSITGAWATGAATLPQIEGEARLAASELRRLVDGDG